MTNTTLDQALRLAEMGWRLVPFHSVDVVDGKTVCTCSQGPRCEKPGKHPTFSAWPTKATSDPRKLREWWHRWPKANLALATGIQSGVVVLDFDGEEGLKTADMLRARYGAWPDTLAARSGGGGLHIFFRAPSHLELRSGSGVLGPRGDMRGEGGSLILAPSRHASGHRYEWYDGRGPGDVQLAELPEQLAREIHDALRSGQPIIGGKASHRIAQRLELPDVIGEGQRNDALFRFASDMWQWAGADKESVWHELVAANRTRARPPLGDKELKAIWDRATTYDRTMRVGLEMPEEDEAWLQSLLERDESSAPPPSDDAPRIQLLNTAPDGFVKSELGNAERVFARHGENIRYIRKHDHWYIWDGHRWAEDECNAVARLAADTMRSLHAQADDLTKRMIQNLVDGECKSKFEKRKAKARSAFATWVCSSESAHGVKAAVTQLETMAAVARRPDDLDGEALRDVLCTPGGYVRLDTGDVEAPMREPMATKSTRVAYDASAKCPMWEEHVRTLTGGDESVAGFLQRAVGYSMTGRTDEQCIFFLCGHGKNGKSTFVNVIRRILGDYGDHADFSSFLETQKSDMRADLAALVGARMVTATEPPLGTKFDEAVIKGLTGGEPIKCRFLRGQFFKYKPTYKIWLAANHRPTITGQDDGIWRRMKLIHLETQISDGKKILGYEDRLVSEEAAGILAWAVRGAHDWYARGGLDTPETITRATDAYRGDSDIFQLWVEERCISQEGQSTLHSVLYSDFREFCEVEQGIRKISSKRLASELDRLGYVKFRGNGGKTYRRNLCLKTTYT